MPGSYSPDFLVRTAEKVWIVETKAQKDLSSTNVKRKARSAKSWCDRINQLDPDQRSHREWKYVVLGQDAVESFRARGMKVSDLLDYATVTGDSVVQERLL